MRNLFTVLLLAVALPGCCIAGIEIFGDCKEGPRGQDQNLAGEPITSFDFGTMRPDSTASYTWQIANVGDEPGYAFATVADCQWVTITQDPSGQLVLPGESVQITAQLSYVGAPCVPVQCEIETGVE
jgi:hypothetical protein